jgi:hypothetical protein
MAAPGHAPDIVSYSDLSHSLFKKVTSTVLSRSSVVYNTGRAHYAYLFFLTGYSNVTTCLFNNSFSNSDYITSNSD